MGSITDLITGEEAQVDSSQQALNAIKDYKLRLLAKIQESVAMTERLIHKHSELCRLSEALVDEAKRICSVLEGQSSRDRDSH